VVIEFKIKINFKIIYFVIYARFVYSFLYFLASLCFFSLAFQLNCFFQLMFNCLQLVRFFLIKKHCVPPSDFTINKTSCHGRRPQILSPNRSVCSRWANIYLHIAHPGHLNCHLHENTSGHSLRPFRGRWIGFNWWRIVALLSLG